MAAVLSATSVPERVGPAVTVRWSTIVMSSGPIATSGIALLAAATVVSQLKADVWWNGSAAWHLAVREGSRLDVFGLLAGSEYLTNLLTHAIPLFEIGFAAGVWPRRSRRATAPDLLPTLGHAHPHAAPGQAVKEKFAQF
mgnify:CR=1 FL=1